MAYINGKEIQTFYINGKSKFIASANCVVGDNTNTDIGDTEGLAYTLSSDGTYYTCSGIGTATDADIVIAKDVDGIPVTEIGSYAFRDCDSLTSVTIPNSVTAIGEDAFYSCNSLMSVVIGNGVTTIGDYAFNYCRKLVEVINHSSLDITVGSTDNGRVAYNAIEVHTGESKILNYNDYRFYIYDGVNYLVNYVGDETKLTLPESYNGEGYEIYGYAFCYNDKLESVVIPDIVATIGEGAFGCCSSLTSVTIGNSVTAIGDWAFYECTSLTSITIPDSVTTIGDWAFSDCSSLTSVTIGNSVTAIGDWAFSDSSLTDVYYTGTEEEWAAIVIKTGNYGLPSATIHYNYTQTLTVININNTTETAMFTMPEGYTWDDFISSEYNTNNIFTIGGSDVVRYNGFIVNGINSPATDTASGTFYYDGEAPTPTTKTMEIINSADGTTIAFIEGIPNELTLSEFINSIYDTTDGAFTIDDDEIINFLGEYFEEEPGVNVNLGDPAWGTFYVNITDQIITVHSEITGDLIGIYNCPSTYTFNDLVNDTNYNRNSRFVVNPYINDAVGYNKNDTIHSLTYASDGMARADLYDPAVGDFLIYDEPTSND